MNIVFSLNLLTKNKSTMACSFKVIYSILSLTISTQGVTALKDVKLSIEPQTVRLFHDSILSCTYDLEEDRLYSVKWYRGAMEFYRYLPTEVEKVKVFRIEGFTVDEALSNSTQVYLRNISDFKHSGNFSCEVTADGHNTVMERRDIQAMQVVQLPAFPPKISVGRSPLDIGDVLKANCSSPPSKPPAELRMSLNNLVISRTDMRAVRRKYQPDWSDLAAELPLTKFHFKEGTLKLECVAQVAGVYSENAVLYLDSARHPIPERVSYGGATSSVSINKFVGALALISFLIINN